MKKNRTNRKKRGNIIQSGIDKVRDIFKDEIDEFAAQHAIYNPNSYKKTDIQKLLSKYQIEKIGNGLHARAFRIKDHDWIIKEGRWDLDFSFMGNFKVPVPRILIQKVMNLFKFQFIPSKKNVQRDYSDYLEFAQYLGYFKSDKDFPHPNRELMFLAQKNIRDTLMFYKPAIERKYHIKLHDNIDKVLTDKSVIYTNFLPKEYQLFGDSISKENKGKETSYIIQEYIKGQHLVEVKDRDLPRKIKKQLILMIYLIFLMHMQVGLLPDTKPKGGFKRAYNWLTDTENIVITKQRLIFIDTRWFWDVHSNIVRRGFVIPKLIIQRAKFSINSLLKQI